MTNASDDCECNYAIMQLCNCVCVCIRVVLLLRLEFVFHLVHVKRDNVGGAGKLGAWMVVKCGGREVDSG